jgi:hypothetical protein
LACVEWLFAYGLSFLRAVHFGFGLLGLMAVVCRSRFACKTGDLAAVQLKVALGWNAKSMVDRHGLTALQWAAGGGHLAVVVYLLAECGVKVDTPNKEGRTPLMWACRNGR